MFPAPFLALVSVANPGKPNPPGACARAYAKAAYGQCGTARDVRP